MRVVVAGLGVQGHKRRRIAGSDCVATADPVNPDADYRALQDVPLDAYDAALVCVPDKPKIELLAFLAENGKHALVEKPLWAAEDAEIDALQKCVTKNRVVCYSAYNHRFEPHFLRMRDVLASGVLGRIYRCRMFYGNGTARLVRESPWRDKGGGVVPDLGSHLIDTVAFWFGDTGGEFRVSSSSRFENRSPDHAVITNETGRPKIELEMTLLMWRNHFTCDVLAENGSAHISSLCKWGPAKFTLRRRVLPSGRPLEDAETVEQADPTWAAEYAHFKALCAAGRPSDLSWDRRLNTQLRSLGAAAEKLAS